MLACVNLSWLVLGYDGLASYATLCYANCKFMLCSVADDGEASFATLWFTNTFYTWHDMVA